MISTFDAHGKFQMPPDDVLADLTDERRGRLDALRDAALSNERAEQELADALDAQRESVRVKIEKQNAFDRACPPLTPVEAARQWIATQRAQRGV
jgi:hypothetical protein